MTNGAKDIWLFRIVHQDTGKPAQGVPVTVLDRAGNAEGHWVSDADGTVAIPRRETARLRLRVGLRSEDPIELATATLGEGPTPLAAPTHLPATIGSIGLAGERPAVWVMPDARRLGRLFASPWKPDGRQAVAYTLKIPPGIEQGGPRCYPPARRPLEHPGRREQASCPLR